MPSANPSSRVILSIDGQALVLDVAHPGSVALRNAILAITGTSEATAIRTGLGDAFRGLGDVRAVTAGEQMAELSLGHLKGETVWVSDPFVLSDPVPAPTPVKASKRKG